MPLATPPSSPSSPPLSKEPTTAEMNENDNDTKDKETKDKDIQNNDTETDDSKIEDSNKNDSLQLPTPTPSAAVKTDDDDEDEPPIAKDTNESNQTRKDDAIPEEEPSSSDVLMMPLIDDTTISSESSKQQKDQHESNDDKNEIEANIQETNDKKTTPDPILSETVPLQENNVDNPSEKHVEELSFDKPETTTNEDEQNLVENIYNELISSMCVELACEMHRMVKTGVYPFAELMQTKPKSKKPKFNHEGSTSGEYANMMNRDGDNVIQGDSNISSPNPTGKSTSSSETIEETNTLTMVTRKKFDRALDIWGNLTPKEPEGKNNRVVCPVCGRAVAANRFAVHLDKCMGLSGTSSRASTRTSWDFLKRK